MYCGSTSIVKTASTHKVIYCLKCRSWGCEECAPERAYQLRRLAKDGKPTRFLTLTIRFHDGDDPDEKARQLARAWRLLRQRIVKKYRTKKVEFLAVWERTKRGAPHLHIFLRGRYMRQAWLSEQMADLIDSHVVDIRKIENQQKAANYVAKYITKASAKFEGCKRYWRSQGYSLRPPKEKEAPEEGIEWHQSSGSMWGTVTGLLDAFGGVAYMKWNYWVWVPPGSAGPPRNKDRKECDPLWNP